VKNLKIVDLRKSMLSSMKRWGDGNARKGMLSKRHRLIPHNEMGAVSYTPRYLRVGPSCPGEQVPKMGGRTVKAEEERGWVNTRQKVYAEGRRVRVEDNKRDVKMCPVTA